MRWDGGILSHAHRVVMFVNTGYKGRMGLDGMRWGREGGALMLFHTPTG